MLAGTVLRCFGEVADFVAEGETGISYHVFTPESGAAHADSRPLLIAFSPSGNGMGILKKLEEAAADVGWTLVGVDQLRNRLNDHELELRMEDEALDDIFRRVPHDPERVYLGGFSGGAMRAYGLTARRPEPFAGILAFGGWLGGPEYQDLAYRRGMAVAMVNGIADRGAAAWVAIDAATLRARACRVKHFVFRGGHEVAPPEISRMAVAWLDNQWKQRSGSRPADGVGPDGGILGLTVLCVGDDPARLSGYAQLLEGRCARIESLPSDSLTVEAVNRADVLLVDAVPWTLPEGVPKAMVVTGRAAALTAERLGSKFSIACQTSAGRWSGTENGGAMAVVFRADWLRRAPDVEILEEIDCGDGARGVVLGREAHRVFWGYAGSPDQLTDAGRLTLLDALGLAHRFEGALQKSFAGIRTRDQLAALFSDGPQLDAERLRRWFPDDVIKAHDGDPDRLRAWFMERLDYVHIRPGSGLLSVDADAEFFGTPNNTVASIERWIRELEGDEGRRALRLLLDYTRQRIRRRPAAWTAWLDGVRDRLEFSDERGYRFLERE